MVLGLWLALRKAKAWADGGEKPDVADIAGWFLIGFAVRSLLGGATAP